MMDGEYSSPGKGLFSPRHRALTPRRSLLSSTVKANIYGSGGRSVQTSEVIYKTATHTIENFGLALPVLVTEALTFSDSNAQVSAKLSSDGWSWLVVGRKLLVWQHGEQRQASHLPTVSGTCRELTLPQTDLAHKADLVSIFFSNDKLIPSCFAVSPEGVVRYWSSIAQEANYKDHTVALQGQECHSLINVMPFCCVLATTTFTFVAVGLGRNKQGTIEQRVVSKTLRPPSGWLAGISYKVSSLIFGVIPSNQMMETKLVNVSVVSDDLLAYHSKAAPNCPRVACITVGPCLEVWSLPTLDDSFLVPEKLLYVVDLRLPLREAFVQGQMFPGADVGSLDLFVLDNQNTKNGLLLLTAAVNLARSPQLKYALTLISVTEKTSSRVLSFVPLQPTAFYRDESDVEALSWKLIWTPQFTYLYNRKQITAVSSTLANDNPNVIEFIAPGDKLLGGSLCNDTPLFITKNHGVISIKPNRTCDSPISSPILKDKLDISLSLFDPEQIEHTDKLDPVSRLKSAYVFYLRNNMTACWQILEELFPAQPLNSNITSSGLKNIDVDSFLDRTVSAVYREILNDLTDPNNRLESKRRGNFVDAVSIHVQIHLHEKLKAMVSFTEFLNSVRLWHRLGLSSGEDDYGTIPTAVFSRGIVELVVATIALSKVHEGSYTHLINIIIQKAVKSLNEVEEKGDLLSLTDIFYSYPTYSEKAFPALGDYCVEQSESDNSKEHIGSIFQKANHIIITVLKEVHAFRKDKEDLFSYNGNLKASCSTIVTWSCKQSWLATLTTQQALTVKQASSSAVSIKLSGQLFDQAVNLADLTLTDAKAFYSKSQNNTVAFGSMTKEMVKTLADSEKYQHATIIAEKYQCFEMLVLICDKTGDKDKFYQYLSEYEDQGFANCAYAWYADAGRLSTLLSLFRERGADGLRDWLSSERGARSELQWCHEVQRGHFLPAADSLVRLVVGERQKDIIGRVKNMMSLAKLCCAASYEAPEEMRSQVDHYLNLLEHHEGLPPRLVDYHGFGSQLENETMRLMTPEEIVQLYLHTDLNLTAQDYARALGAAELAEDDETRSELKMKIWCHTILKDDWTDYNPEDLVTSVADKMFFKVIDYIHILDYDLNEYLPQDTDLLDRSELNSLENKREFQNLLRYGYQYVGQASIKRQQDEFAMEQLEE